MNIEHWWNDGDRERRITRRKICPGVTFSKTDRTLYVWHIKFWSKCAIGLRAIVLPQSSGRRNFAVRSLASHKSLNDIKGDNRYLFWEPHTKKKKEIQPGGRKENVLTLCDMVEQN